MFKCNKNLVISILCCLFLTISFLGFLFFPSLVFKTESVCFNLIFSDFLHAKGELKQLTIFSIVGLSIGLLSWICLIFKKDEYIPYVALFVFALELLGLASSGGCVSSYSRLLDYKIVKFTGGTYIIVLSLIVAVVLGFYALLLQQKRDDHYIEDKKIFSHLIISRICFTGVLFGFLLPILATHTRHYSGIDSLLILYSNSEINLQFFIAFSYYGTIVCLLSWLTLLSKNKKSIVIFPFIALIMFLVGMIASWSGNKDISLSIGFIIMLGCFTAGIILSVLIYGEVSELK